MVAADLEPFFNKKVTNESIKKISISPDGEFIASASQDNYIQLIDKNGSLRWNLKIEDGVLNDVATNGELVVAGMGYYSRLNSRQFEGGSVRLYSRSGDAIFDNVIEQADANSSGMILHVAISMDGGTIVASGKNKVYILDKTGDTVMQIPVNGFITDLAMSPNKEIGAVSSGDTVYLFDNTWRMFQDFKVDNNTIQGISISNDGYIAILTRQNIYLYENDKRLWEKEADISSYYTSITISPYGNLIAVNSAKEGFFLFDKNGVEVLQYPGYFNYVSTGDTLITGVKNSYLSLFNIISYTTGSISIYSTQGARVYLDEMPAGTVPATLSNLPAGTHSIKIIKDGYESWVQNINISYGDRKEISVMLVPSVQSPVQSPVQAPGTIARDIIVIPENALYFIMLGAILILFPGVVYSKLKKRTAIPPSHVPGSSINEQFIGSNCPYCGDIVKANSRITVCPDCQTPHHRDCWNKHKGCTTYGCRSAP